MYQYLQKHQKWRNNQTYHYWVSTPNQKRNEDFEWFFLYRTETGFPIAITKHNNVTFGFWKGYFKTHP